MVLYFASVLEKEKAESSKNSKIKVALVCETGRGTAQFMLAKLHTLDAMIDIVSVSSVHNTKEIQNSGAQMIVSTIPLESELPCVVVRSAILNTDDLLDVQRKVFELIEDDGDKEIPEMQLDVINPVESDIQGAFYNLLSQDRVMVDYEADDWEDAVRQSGILLRDSGAVTDAYVDAMVENRKRKWSLCCNMAGNSTSACGLPGGS